MCMLFGLCPAQRLKIPHDVADVNTTTNKFHAVILHFVKNVCPLPADYRHADQIDHQLASPERITSVLPSSGEFRGPRFNNSACENELSLNFGFDRRDLQHCSSTAAMPKSNGNAKDNGTTSR